MSRNRYRYDEPSVILTSGPASSRAADDTDPPYEPPRVPLGFTARSTSATPTRDDRIFSMPLLWDGDQA